jgi:predicted CXXCH cytochrome family protein
MQRTSILKLAALCLGSAFLFFTHVAQSQENKPLDPKAWGATHAGKPVPEYTTGDQCLFCHRNTIGPSWFVDGHARTVRHREDASDLTPLVKAQPALAAVDKQIEYFLGHRHVMRLLQKDGYGKFALLSAKAELVTDAKGGKTATAWHSTDQLTWDKQKFALQCAGCHASGLDAQTKTFSAFGLDCYTCHGEVHDNHSNDISLVWLSKKRRDDKRAITSLCAACHLRDEGGSVKSASTGLPYPNNFVMGDNVFQDFVVDWKQADNDKLNPADRHVWRNVRDVAVNNEDKLTCLSCHQVHEAQGADATLRHRRLPRAPICFDCHSQEEGKFKEVKKYVVKSSLCEY